MRIFAALAAALAVAGLTSSAVANVRLIEDRLSGYNVVLAKDASLPEKRAAAEFKRFVTEMSGAVLPYAPDDGKTPAKAVYIGDSKALQSLGLNIDVASLGPEEYVIKSVGDSLIIVGGRPRGTMYGVYAFLEDQLGCRWYSSKVNRIPQRRTITLGKLDIQGKPTFEYRDLYYRDSFDKNWAARNRMNGGTADLDNETGGGISYYPFCHTFRRLVPLDTYWETHPEYYSLIDGKRTNRSTQLCLSNPEVLKIATQTVMTWAREHPDATLYSVTQNDCYNNCQCPNCKKIYEEEGSPSGLVLRFVNAIAEAVEKAYPGKMIDTVAYQWTEKPPKITKPRHNVRVRLCPIFCCEAHPYEKCEWKDNVAFLKNLDEWSKVTDNLYIWHYNTSFSHYQTPFPDFGQFPDSARLYKKFGSVKGVFWEGNYSKGGCGELAELRAWMLAKLTWNPNLDADALMRDFLDGYYGKSGKYIYQYIQLLENKVLKENIHVRIWSNPTDKFLTPEIVKKSDELLAKAESVAETPEILEQVKLVHLNIEYVKFMQPIMNKQTKGREAELTAALDAFVAKCRHYGITHPTEWRVLDAYYEKAKRAIAGRDSFTD